MTRRNIRADFARAVHDYLLVEQTALAPADLGLVFGNRRIIEPLARHAADLYHTGYFPLIVAAGGVQTKGNLTEAEAVRRALIKKGVPVSAILTEQESRHTGENVLMTRALLAQKGLERNIASVIGIGHIVAARRFLMTLERHWPEIHKMHVSANPFGVPAKDWHTHGTFRHHALQEWDKIEPYQADGKIREIDLAALERVTRRLQMMNAQPPSSDSVPQPL